MEIPKQSKSSASERPLESSRGQDAEQLAQRGGTPVLPEGPPGWPRPDDDVLRALEAAYRDGSWGKYEAGQVERLASELAAMHGVEHCLACSSGTFAVELALRALKVGPRDLVAVAGYDFGGNFRAIEAVGARPVLIDIEPATWCLDPAALESWTGPGLKAIIVSHLHGGLADMPRIVEWCRQRGIAVVEDACQAQAATVYGRPAGAWGDVGVLSFGGSKLLTAGRGGAILTQQAEVAQRAKIFCERGNHAFPLSELQAAVLLPQLGKLTGRHAVRQQRVSELLTAMGSLAGLVPVQNPAGRGSPAYYKLAWRYDADALGGRLREAFVEAIQAEGVAIDVGFRGFVGRSQARCLKHGDLPHSRQAAQQTLVLHHPVLLEPSDVIERVAQAIGKVVRAFSS